jgi:hypothetical protein
MTQPPADNLEQWTKTDLISELRRLRAVTREHAEQRGDTPGQQPTTGALLNISNAVLMDTSEVVLVDTKHDQPISIVLTLRGRINYAHDRIEHAYLLGPDGTAMLVSQLMGLAAHAAERDRRFAAAFAAGLAHRLNDKRP